MSDYVSKPEIVERILSTMKSSQLSTLYPKISVLCTILVIIAYIKTYRNLKSIIPRGGSSDIKFLTGTLTVSGLWNVAMCSQYCRIFDLTHILEFLDAGSDDFSLVNPGHHNSSAGSLNSIYKMKDAIFVVITIVSIVLINWLAVGGMRCVEYISFISNNQQSEPQPKTHRKSVSFDENLITYTYLDKEIQDEDIELEPVDSTATAASSHTSACGFLTLSKLPNQSILFSYMGSKLVQGYVISVAVTFIMAVFFLPSTLQLSSSAVWMDFDPDSVSSVKIKSDHIYFAFFVSFFFHTSYKFYQMISFNNAYHKSKSFPNSLLIIARFIWFYDCAILGITLFFMVLSSDLFINSLHVFINDSALMVGPATSSGPDLNNSHAYSSNTPIQFVTSVLIDYLSHSSLVPAETLSTCTEALCAQHQMLSSFAASFSGFKANVTNCWVVFNLFCFTILPAFMWFAVTFKLSSVLQSKTRNSPV